MRMSTPNIIAAHTCRAKGRRPRSGTEGAIRHCVQRFCSVSTFSSHRSQQLPAPVFRCLVGCWHVFVIGAGLFIHPPTYHATTRKIHLAGFGSRLEEILNPDVRVSIKMVFFNNGTAPNRSSCDNFAGG